MRTRSRLKLVALVLALSSPAFAKEDVETVATESQARPYSLAAHLHLSTMQNNDTTLTGIGPSVAFRYATSPRFALGAAINQSFGNPGEMSALHTQIEVQAVYALTGSLVRFTEKTYVDSPAPVVSVQERYPGGLRVFANVHQYVFNTSSGGSFTGIGGGAFYALPSRDRWHWVFGGRVERSANSKSAVYPLQVFGGIEWEL